MLKLHPPEAASGCRQFGCPPWRKVLFAGRYTTTQSSSGNRSRNNQPKLKV